MKKVYLSILAGCLASAGAIAQTVTFSNPTSASQCDGTATFSPGPVTAWTWFHDTTQVQVNGTKLSSLCPGKYSVHFQDAGGNPVMKPFDIMGNTGGPMPPVNNSRVNIKSATTTAACDGEAHFNAGPLSTWKWFKNDTSLIKTGGLDLLNLCEGDYSVQYLDSTNNNVIDRFHIGLGNNSPPPGSPNRITTHNQSVFNKCNGYANFDQGPITSWKWLQNGIVLQNGGVLLDSLCEGNYNIEFLDSLGSTITNGFFIGTDSGSTNPGPNPGSRVSFMNPSSAANCDGNAHFDQRTIPSWKWFRNDTILLQTDGADLDSLCSGNYAVQYLDSATNTFIYDRFSLGGGNNPPPNPGGNSRITIKGVSAAGSCDGVANFDKTAVTAWKWYNANGILLQTRGLILDSLCEGNYYVQYTDSTGTVKGQFFIGRSGPNPVPNPGNPGRVTVKGQSVAAVCDGTATFDARSSTMWKWFKDSTLIKTGGLTLDSLCSGNYSVQFLDSANTYVTNPFFIGVGNGGNTGGGGGGKGNCPGFEAHAVSTNAKTAASCDGSGEIVIVQPGTAPYTFFWSDSVTTKTRTGMCAGGYHIRVEDSNGCFYTDSVSVYVVNTANPCQTFQAHVLPHGETVPGACDGSAEAIADGGVAPYSYKWNNSNANTKINTNLCSGFVTVTIIDGNNCAAKDSTSIGAISAVNPKPCQFFAVSTIVLNDTMHTVAGTTCGGYIEAVCKGGRGPLKYVWSDNAANKTPYHKKTCEGQYFVTVTDSVGCSATMHTFVGGVHPPVMPPTPGVAPLHIFVKTMDATNAAKCDGKAYAKVVGGKPPYTCSLGAVSATGNYFTSDSLCAGFYTVNAMDADSVSTSFVFVIGSPVNTYTPPRPPFVNPVVVDTLVSPAVSTCAIDYDAIDSIRVTKTKFITNDTVRATWTVYQTVNNVGSTYLFTQYYRVSSTTGIFNFVLDLFCTNRLSGSAKAVDQIQLGKSTTGIEEVVGINTSVYPNPFSDELNVIVDKYSTISIFDITGRIVYSGVVNAGNNTISTDQLNSGMYFVNVTCGSTKISKKLIKP